MKSNKHFRWIGGAFSHQTESKIWSFLNLRAGWHLGEGVQFSERDVRSAIALHARIVGAGFIETNAFPGLSGEVRITIYQGEYYAEFTLEANGKWTFVLEHGSEEKQCKEMLSFEEAVSIIKTLTSLCGLFERYHVVTGTLGNNAFKAWLLSHQASTEESQFSRKSVLSERVEAFVDTFIPSTSELPVNLRFFGNLAPTRFHRELNYLTVPIQMEIDSAIGIS